MSHPDETYYDILSVPKDASLQQITSSYRRLAKILHPDVCESPDAEELFKAVNEAYHILRDPDKRAEYDAFIADVLVLPQGRYYQGRQKYRDPRTWYYAHHQNTTKKHTHKSDNIQPKKTTIPRFIQVLLFYTTLFMGTIIITQLFLLPWIEGVNASDARAAFNEGNRWLEEEEYQKAIESFESATARLPSFSEAWRAKGIAEIKKADGLSRLMRPDADTYYRNAIKSFSHVKNQDGQDSVVTKGLARAFMNIGEERKALSIVTSAYNAQDPDPEMASLIQELTKLMNTKGNVPQQTS